MGFSRQEDWSGLPCPPPGDFPDPGIEPVSPIVQADCLTVSHQGSPRITESQHRIAQYALITYMGKEYKRE